MRHFRNALIALLIGCFVPVVIWVTGGVALYQRTVENSKRRRLARVINPALTCHIDTDCPPGYACVNGCCVPENAA